MHLTARPAIMLSLALLWSLAGCSPDRNTTSWDSGRRDTGTDARIDGGMDSGRRDSGRGDTGNDVTDSGPRDTWTPPVDTGPPDTGSSGGMCVDSCSSDTQCQSSCPAAPSGMVYCCSSARDGVCYINMGTTCPGSSTDDAGTIGDDGGFPFPGTDAGTDDGGLGCFLRRCGSDIDCASCGSGYRCIFGICFDL
jgi:hypothetical protein